MSAAPDPAELAPSRDPAAYGRRPLFSSAFFIWLLLCVTCLAAGAAIGRFGFPAEPAPRVESAAPETTSRASPSPPASAPTSPMTAPTSSGATSGADAGSDAALSDRVTKLEAGASHENEAAAGALAAASLSVAAEGSAPFDHDLAAYERLSPDDPDLRALVPLAVRGAPSRATLAETLPDFAAAAVVAAREPAKDAGFFTKLWAMFGKVVIVRRVDPTAAGVDGLLARAQDQASSGDLEDAVSTLQRLPTPARAQLADWTAAAGRRIEIDQRVAAIRARALSALLPPAAAGAQGVHP